MVAVPCGNVKKKFPVVAKMMALVIAMVMMVAMVVPAMAAEPSSYSVTITQNAADTGTHTYGAYKIFKGDLNNGTLSNLAWADGLTINDTVAGNIAIALSISAADAKVATKVAEALDGLAKDADAAKAFADAIEPALTTVEKQVQGTGNLTIEGLTGGYYLIKDISNPTVASGQYASQTKFILEVTKPTNTVTVKSSVPSIKKQVEDKADSTATTGSYGDSADHDVNDTFHYTLTATLGSGVDNYKQYYLKFKDTMSDGLTMGSIESVIVDYDGNLTTTDDQVNITGNKTFTQNGTATVKATDGTTDLTAKVYELEIRDLFTETGVARPSVDASNNAVPGATAGSKVVVTYTATLNSTANVGKLGNPNDVELVYGSNPNYEGNGTPDTETTPKDRNVVFTYKTVVNKVQPNPDYDSTDPTSKEYISLDKAGFTLYKAVTNDYVAKTGETVKTGEAIKSELAASNASILATDLVNATRYVVISSTETAGASATFTFSGLDDGNYVLVETTIPAGFNAFDSVAFIINAEHSLDSEDPQLISLNSITKDSQSTEVVLEGDQKGNVDLTAGQISTDVVNKKGSVLPSTGGIGTTIFYILGAILVLGAGVLLVTRRRMSAN